MALANSLDIVSSKTVSPTRTAAAAAAAGFDSAAGQDVANPKKTTAERMQLHDKADLIRLLKNDP